MEHLNRAQLSSVLTQPVANLRRSLSKEDSSTLLALMESLAKRYPSQDLESSIAEFHQDYESLALKHGLPLLQMALESLRIKRGQKFFPRPDEVVEQIETELERERSARALQAQDRRRQQEIDEFWANLPYMLERTGLTEDEFLKRWPSMRGTKPAARTVHAHAANVVSMPARDRKSAAVGDDAA